LVEDEDGWNTLQNLMLSCADLNENEKNQLIDNRNRTELNTLRGMDLLKKDDIQEYELVLKLCNHSYFAENQFRFLVEWDPMSLLQSNGNDGWTPLFQVARNGSSIQGFQMVFDYVIRYFPYKKGISLLFTKNTFGGTFLRSACEWFYIRKQVLEVVDEVLARYSNTTPLNIVDALMLAAIDETIHLDGVYFLLRREPEVLIALLSRSTNDSSNIDGNFDGGHHDNEDDYDYEDIDDKISGGIAVSGGGDGARSQDNSNIPNVDIDRNYNYECRYDDDPKSGRNEDSGGDGFADGNNNNTTGNRKKRKRDN